MRNKLWRLFLQALRTVTLAVDDWIQREEVKLREPFTLRTEGAARAAALAEVEPIASKKRERAQRQARRAIKPAFPRLRYQHGTFVRQNG